MRSIGPRTTKIVRGPFIRGSGGRVPFHYAHPVTGKPPRITPTHVYGEQPGAAAVTGAALGAMPADVAAQLREIGARIEAQKTGEIYAPLHPKEPYAWAKVARDIAYGAAERTRVAARVRRLCQVVAHVWKAYYGEDVAKYAERSSLSGLVKSAVPLLVTDAELDPEMFRVETQKLVDARAAAGKPVQRVHLMGHSHISETYAVGTADRSLSAPVLELVRSVSKSGT